MRRIVGDDAVRMQSSSWFPVLFGVPRGSIHATMVSSGAPVAPVSGQRSLNVWRGKNVAPFFFADSRFEALTLRRCL